MTGYELLTYAPLAAALAWATVTDVRARRIPNWLTFGLLLTGLLQGFGPAAAVTPTQSLAGAALGFGLTFVLFAVGGLGAGDVKLIAAVGAWTGPAATLWIFAAVAIVAMALAVGQSLAQGRGRALAYSTATVAVGLVHARELGATHAADAARRGGAVDRPLPYAVAVLIAFALFAACR